MPEKEENRRRLNFPLRTAKFITLDINLLAIQKE